MKHKKLIIALIILVIVSITSYGIYKYVVSEDSDTSLTLVEKQWIQSNKNKVIDISIINDLPVLNYHGEGIFFDFLSSLEEDTGLVLNKVSYSINDSPKSAYAFKKTDIVSSNDILIYQDTYVLLTRTNIKYDSLSDISNMNIGVLSNDLAKVSHYMLGTSNITYKSYETSSSMFLDYNKEVEEGETNILDAIILPKTLYLAQIVENDNVNIVYNITECSDNYVLSLGEDSKLNDILKKYYKKWDSKSFDDSYTNHLANSYFEFKGIDDKDKVKFRSKRYVYGFIENKPYDTIIDGKMKGISNSFLTDFAHTSDIEISYKEYSSIKSLIAAFNANEIDFFFSNNSDTKYEMDVYNTISSFNEKIDVISSLDNNIVINSLNTLTNNEVSTIADSKIAAYLTTFNIKLKLYDSVEKLVNSKDDIIVMDDTSYQYYVRNELSKYKVDYSTNIDSEYNYMVRDIKDNQVFQEFFSFYLSFASEKTHYNSGLDSIINVNSVPIILERIAIISVTVLMFGIVIILVIRLNPKKKKRKMSNLSKEDKLRYIDMLTSLKNRSYLNDHIELWDESDVYPQTIIIVDLNDIAYINDNYGHAEGDNVIREAANILIKNQIPNTEIIRTNGNEFLIYLVSYDEKQVLTYMRKLSKEFKDLAHGFGAAIGYSMIVDAIKTIDDAVNEATLDMRNNKEESK